MAKEFTFIRREIPMWVVDRFEEGWAVLENAETRETINLPKDGLPRGVKPGDTLRKHHSLGWYLDNAETAARAKRISERFNRIKGRALD